MTNKTVLFLVIATIMITGSLSVGPYSYVDEDKDENYDNDEEKFEDEIKIIDDRTGQFILNYFYRL